MRYVPAASPAGNIWIISSKELSGGSRPVASGSISAGLASALPPSSPPSFFQMHADADGGRGSIAFQSPLPILNHGSQYFACAGRVGGRQDRHTCLSFLPDPSMLPVCPCGWENPNSVIKRYERSALNPSNLALLFCHVCEG